MGVRDLFFAIKARDESDTAFNRVKGNLRSVDGLMMGVNDRMKRFGAGAIRVGAGMTAGMAPVILAFRDSLSLFDFQERAQAKVTQGVKATGGAAGFAAEELFRQASALQEITRFGDEEILNGVTSQLLTFTNIAGAQFSRAQTAALDLATTLDGDLQSSAIMLGKALNDPAKGLSAMGRAGITFSEDQKDVIKALQETGDLAAAQTLILEELERQYGGQAEAAASAGLGAMSQLSNSFGDLREEVGGVIADILPPMVDFFKDLVSGFQGLDPPIRKAIVVIGLIAGVAGPATLALGALSLAIGAISAPVLLVVGGIAALVGITAALWPETDATTQATNDLTIALGEEMTQSKNLSDVIANQHSMTIEMARMKLTEAHTRLQNVQAIHEERRALELMEKGRLGVGAASISEGRADDADAALRGGSNLGPTGQEMPRGIIGDDFMDPREQAVFEGRVNPFAVSADSVQVDKGPIFSEEHADDISLIKSNISDLQSAIDNAEGGLVRLGGEVAEPIVPVDNLTDGIDRLAAAARKVKVDVKSVGDGLKDTTKDVEKAKGVFEGFGRETGQMLKDMVIDGRLSFSDFGDFILSWGQRFLGRVLDQVFDPLATAVESMFANAMAGAFTASSQSGGGGGIFNSLIGGATNLLAGAFGGATTPAAPAMNSFNPQVQNLPLSPTLKFDTEGVMGVSGRNGIDRNVARFGVSNDEQIHVIRRGKEGTGRPINVQIVAQDPATFKGSKTQIGRTLAAAVRRGERAM